LKFDPFPPKDDIEIVEQAVLNAGKEIEGIMKMFEKKEGK
jgi:hypothetical protein